MELQGRRILILVNPHAGRRSVQAGVDRLVDLLREEGFSAEVHTDLTQVAAQANELHAAGALRVLVGVGGDGTAAELINRTTPGVPVTLFPAGTANLVARQFHILPAPEKICETIVRGRLVPLDVGRASGRLFLAMVSCGLDAEVVRLVDQQRHASSAGRHISYLSYLKPILRAIRTYNYPEMSVSWEVSDGCGERWSAPVPARWVFAFNLPRYAWGLTLAPQARADDAAIDLCTFARGSTWSGLRYLIASQGRCQTWLSDFMSRRCHRLRITAEAAVPYQVDGDPGGQLPVEVDVLPGRFTLLTPPSAG